MGVLQGVGPPTGWMLVGWVLLLGFLSAADAQSTTVSSPLLPSAAAGLAQLQEGATRLQQGALLLTATAANVLPLDEAEESAGRTAGNALYRGYQVVSLLTCWRKPLIS